MTSTVGMLKELAYHGQVMIEFANSETIATQEPVFTVIVTMGPQRFEAEGVFAAAVRDVFEQVEQFFGCGDYADDEDDV